jgi:hypothetical protein
MELIDQLTKNLGVSETQAKGGAGLLLQQAKEKLSGADFSKVSSAIPGIDSLIGAAPTGGSGALGGLGGLGDLGSMIPGLGGASGGLSSMAGLAGGFSKLGLDMGMIGKFIPVILSFVQSKGGEKLKAILGKAFQ